ncbi:MAG: hypothetical protein ACYC7D_00355 [Nitrososphaerales archaeon]
MIAVLAELNGERLLGKARELADSQGYRVLAICSDKRKSEADRFIALGADEVESYPLSSVADCISIISNIVRKNNQLRVIFLPSNILGNLILGGVCATAPDHIGSVLDNAESISESGAAKTLPSAAVQLFAGFIENKVSVFSLKLATVPEPFEDSSRYGKVTSSIVDSSHLISAPLLSEYDLNYLDSSSRLVIIEGKTNFSNKDLVAKLVSKFEATHLKEDSMQGRAIYGPCFAIEVRKDVRELPEIYGDLVSINSDQRAPISRVANLSVVEPNVESILEGILAS